jgi:hypothetical protein
MGFKLPGKSITSGTSSHSSALKMREQELASALKYVKPKEPKTSPIEDAPEKPVVKNPKMADKDWKKGQESAKSAGRDLDALVKKRGTLKKGSDEYNVVQNQINKALGSKKRHGKTKVTVTEDKTKTTKKVTPGLSETDISTKTTRGGKKKVTKRRHEDDEGVTTKKIKTKYRKDKETRKRQKTVIKSDYDKDKKVDKKTKIKTKYDKAGDVKRTKRVTTEGGRRTVTKTKDGVTTTKSRRTLKGWLTGKGKKTEEE